MSERPRPRRGAVLDAAILRAVREELAVRGYAGVNFEGVASRAGTSKPVLYRRFPSRAHMVFHALTSSVAFVAPDPLPGVLRDDLGAVPRAARDRFDTAGVETYRQMLAEADADLVARIGRLGDLVIEEIVRCVVEWPGNGASSAPTRSRASSSVRR